MTLLVNYWRDKTAGEAFTLTVPQEAAYLNQYEEIKSRNDNEDSKDRRAVNNRWYDMKEIRVFREFSEDFDYWKQNQVPPLYMEKIASNVDGFWYHDGEKLFTHDSNYPKQNVSAPGVVLKLNSSDIVQMYAEATGSQYHNWPTWSVTDGKLQLMNIPTTREAVKEWRSRMPGGPPLMPKKFAVNAEV